jgi:hypothetical protein
VAADVESAMKRSDAHAMAGFVTNDELKAQGVTRQQVALFFENELFKRWALKGEPITEEDSIHTVFVNFKLQSKVGEPDQGISFFAIPSDSGVDTPTYIRSVIWLNSSAASGLKQLPYDPANRFRNVAAYIKENATRFELTYGLKGLYYEDERKVVGWAEVQERYIKESTKIDERMKAAGAR